MNQKNIIAKTLIAGLACVACCGATLAASHGGSKAPQKAPTHQQAPAPKGGNARGQHPAPAHNQNGRLRGGLRPADVHGAPVTRRAPAPAHREPPPPAHHHGGHHEGAGWTALGATLIGGLIGGIVGACN
ncbi:MAG: hypothetical protein ACI4RD_02220 [Kiritimatiellia bacterium]